MKVQRIVAQLLLGLCLLVSSPAFCAESQRKEAVKVANELLIAIENVRPDVILKYSQSVVYIVDDGYKKSKMRKAFKDKNSWLGQMVFYGEKSMRNYIISAKTIKVRVMSDHSSYWDVSFSDPESRVLVPPMMYIAKIKGKWTLIGIEPFNPDALR